MADEKYEFKAKTVEDAISDGLRNLGLTHADAEIEVLNKGSRGIFGIGSEPAHVRITPRTQSVAPAAAAPKAEPPASSPPVASTTPAQLDKAEISAPPVREPAAPAKEATAMMAESTAQAEEIDVVDDEELAEIGVDMLAELLRLMGFDAEVTSVWQPADHESGDPYLMLEVHGENLGALIGPRGETLDDIQYLLRLMVNQRMKRWKNIVIDIEHYKEKRVTQLTQMALRMADQVQETGRSMLLEPMPSSDRRVVHLALRDHPAVYTESNGEGERRQVQIIAK